MNKHWFVANYLTQKVFIHAYHILLKNVLEQVLKIVSIGLNHFQFWNTLVTEYPFLYMHVSLRSLKLDDEQLVIARYLALSISSFFKGKITVKWVSKVDNNA